LIVFFKLQALILKMRLKYCFIILFIICADVSKAQVFGGNPSSLKFYQINTDTVRIIFPKALEKEAKEVAWTVHQLNKSNPAPLGNKLKKFDLVLQNQTLQSNAYVRIAPYRSEYYMMPPLHNVIDGSIPWHLSLAVHEHRHMEQLANFNRSVPKLLHLFLGQEGTALGFGAAVPDWFFEGDAVWQETIVTQQGRGRLPNFFNAYRSLWQGNKKYSYMKLRNGSFRHFIPNHYDLGYLLVGYGREKYGNDFWKSVTEQAIDYKGLVYPFQHAIKKQSGLKYKKFVNNAFEFFKDQMNTSSEKVLNNMQQVSSTEPNNVSNYQYPFELEGGSMLALKSSYRQIPVWVKIESDGTEKKMRVKDIADDQYYSFKNGKVIYTAYQPHERWGWKEYSILKLWDIESNETVKISSRSRLFMPDINEDGSEVVAMQYTTDLKSSLVLIKTNGDTGFIHLPNTNGYLYTYPKFADRETIIAAVRNEKGEMSLLETNCINHKQTILLPFSNTPLSYVQVYGDSVLFTASQKNGDALYLLKRSTGELFKLKQLPNGSYQPCINTKKGELYVTTFTHNGNQLLKQSLQSITMEKVASLESLPHLYLSSKAFSSSRDLVKHVQQLPVKMKPYKKAFQLLNIHSWRPLIAEPDYGLTLFSENVLNTFVSEYRYQYNRNEGFHQAAATMVYGGFYPQLRAGVEQTWNRKEVDENNRSVTWNQLNVNSGITLPLNFTSGKTFKFLNLSSSINFEQLNYTGAATTFKQNEQFNYFNTSVSFTHQSQRAYQQIFPKWVQTFRLQYRRTINGEFGNQFFANAGFYLPGLFRNQHLVLFGSVQSRDTMGGGKFTNSFPFARGYEAVNFPRVFRLSANYHFPVAYPDFGVGNLFYILRIRANAFYDYTRGRSLRTGRLFPLNTAGCEVYFDTKIWNLFEAGFGIRYSRLLNTDLLNPGSSANQFEIVLPVGLY
jgi:hypothetical protein